MTVEEYMIATDTRSSINLYASGCEGPARPLSLNLSPAGQVLRKGEGGVMRCCSERRACQMSGRCIGIQQQL